MSHVLQRNRLTQNSGCTVGLLIKQSSQDPKATNRTEETVLEQSHYRKLIRAHRDFISGYENTVKGIHPYFSGGPYCTSPTIVCNCSPVYSSTDSSNYVALTASHIQNEYVTMSSITTKQPIRMPLVLQHAQKQKLNSIK